jgi:uncharacterized protein
MALGMTDAKTLLLDVLAAIPDGEKVPSFFAEDGVVELPFLHAIGIQSGTRVAQRLRSFMIWSGSFIRISASNRRIQRF